MVSDLQRTHDQGREHDEIGKPSLPACAQQLRGTSAVVRQAVRRAVPPDQGLTSRDGRCVNEAVGANCRPGMERTLDRPEWLTSDRP